MLSSVPYTGLTSKKAQSVAEVRKEVAHAKRQERAVLLPAYEQIVNDLDAEILRANDLSNYTDGGYVSDDETRFELAARARYVALCKALKSKYTITVKGVKDGQR